MTKLTKITLVAAVLGALTAALPAQAGERLDRIEETKVLRVGTPGDYRPFSMGLEGGNRSDLLVEPHEGSAGRQV